MARPKQAPGDAAPGPRIGLALAGGGPLGAIYEIGALCALQESLDGVDFNDLSTAMSACPPAASSPRAWPTA